MRLTFFPLDFDQQPQFSQYNTPVLNDGNLDFSLDMNGQWELRLSGAVIPVFGDTLTIPALSGNAGDTLSFAANANHDDSIEGYVFQGETAVYGIVDSIRGRNRSSLERSLQ